MFGIQSAKSVLEPQGTQRGNRDDFLGGEIFPVNREQTTSLD